MHPMTKQNDSETIEIRLVVTGRTDDIKVRTAKWLRSNKAEALDFLAQGKKAQILAEDNSTPNQIQGARIESAAFHRYMAEAIGAQVAVGRGDFPTGCSYSPQPVLFTPEPSPSAPIDQPSSLSPQSKQADVIDEDDEPSPIMDID